MTDISKCYGLWWGKKCEKRLTCWRFLAPACPNWQSYSDFSTAGKWCDAFWPVDKHLDKKVDKMAKSQKGYKAPKMGANVPIKGNNTPEKVHKRVHRHTWCYCISNPTKRSCSVCGKFERL